MTIDQRLEVRRTPPPTSRAPWLGVGVLTLPVFLVSMDASVLFLATPRLTAALRPSAAEQLWILDVYGFLIAGLLITMGNLGDRIGRRRLLLAGATLFGLASVVAAFAPSPEVLIAARAAMGVGGATLMPSSLSLLTNLFPDPAQRGRAIGVWTAAFAGGSALGPVIGGVLLHHFWWGSVFLINVPVLAVLLVAAPRWVPEFRTGGSDPFDLVGIVLSMLAILPSVYAIKHLATEGADLSAMAVGLFGLTMLAAFVAYERRTLFPLLDLGLFANRAFTAAILVALLGMVSLAAMFYLTGIYLQSVLGQDVLAAALAGLPVAVTVAVASMGASRVVAHLGVGRAFVVALLAAAAGNGVLLGLGVTHGLVLYMVGTSIAGVGYGVMFSVVSEVAVGSVPAERSGAAAGVSETCFELGSALGLAVLGSLAVAVFRSRDDGRGFGDTLSATLLSTHDQALADAARAAFVDGLHAATLVGVVLLVLSAVLVGRARLTLAGAAEGHHEG
ncbi:MFS transporter [Nocardioides acrostichi]|uniref:MFS transporter n=1 Tax=Nocardioides acrostichi TaxID=2784339 RepID=A0A930V3E9_9ACTN|nr:MFS transporter [Nocardioides acrostichi]MBF4163274.1 MFS transporter [Nocardioides acrostichi]